MALKVAAVLRSLPFEHPVIADSAERRDSYSPCVAVKAEDQPRVAYFTFVTATERLFVHLIFGTGLHDRRGHHRDVTGGREEA